MVTIKITGSYDRPIRRMVEQDVFGEVENEEVKVVEVKVGTKLVIVEEDEFGNKTETIDLRGDAVLLQDGVNTHLIPLAIGRAEARDGWFIIYQSGQPLRYYKYPFDCNIAHSDLNDLVNKVNALFVKEQFPVFAKETTTDEELKESIRLSQLKIEAYKLQLEEQVLKAKVEAIEAKK